MSSAVTAEHAALRGAWSGNAAGEYTATYTAREAGTDLKASLLLSGWRSAQTAVYAITAGTVATDTSTIHTDKAGYASGESMTVTVVLKDAAGNPVAGQAALLATAVSVAHADLSGSWSDKGEGSYGATYTAKTAGTNLQATLTLNGASATPATYSINAGAVAAGNSAIAIDRQAYISGSDMTVTVSLKDAAGNPVSGQAGSLGDKVAVPNAIMKPGADWTETPAGSGIYIARYVAGAVSTHQTATLRLGGETRPSGTYAITAGTVTTATLAADKATYVAGSSLILTVTLKDAQGNPAPGQAGTLTAETVKAANAELKGSWAETGTAGTYSATYTAKTAGTGLKANLKLGSVTAATPAPYAITAGAVTTATLTADNTTYVAGSPLILTVTLKDAQGNPAPGQAGTLTAETVKAANAELKGSWAETGTAGTYSATYSAKTAGTGLKANLKLGSVTAATPTPYAITAGTVTAATLTADNTTYVAGNPLILTVTLKDAQGNPAPGQAGTLTAETVKAANAELKGTWTETTPGTYSATYTANKAGSNLKASLTLGSTTAASGTYAITAGTVTAATLTADKATYVAGGAITLTVELKDAQGNLVPNQAGTLTAETVKAANAELKGSWTETGTAGTYSATYTAKTAGTGLKANLKLGSVTAATPTPYAITAGTVTAATLTADNTTYVAGNPLILTVTLKDAQGNPAPGQAGTLTAEAVKAANAELKGSWAETGTAGTYSATYTAKTAGTGLKANLKLGSVTAATPTPYAITAGAVTTATLTADNTTYVAGSPLILTVTLKDAQGNPAPGQAGTLTAETVKAANAELKGSWAETGTAGTYSATYTAKTAGTGLKANLKLGSVTAATPTPYAITAGTVTAATLTADNTTYVAGNPLILTVTLKDAQGNPAPGQAGTLTAETVKAANAELKGTWAEAGTAGTYSATYTAKTAGTGLKASLKLGSTTAASGTYAITAGTVTTATLTADNTTYVAGNPLILTVTLKDAQGNPAPGQAGTLTAETVKAANAELKGSWTETTPGTYSATYTAKTAGTGLKANLTLGSVTAATPTPYAITAGTVTAATLTADKATYVAGSPLILTVTLKDAQGNPAPGQAGTLTAETVKAANAELKGTWAEAGTAGTYSATYTAKTAGTGLKASLKLGSTTAASGTYAITAGTVTAATLTADKATYVAGGAITLTVELKDAQGNLVPNQAGTLTAETVKAANAELKGTWAEAGTAGTYSATYTANKAGSNLKASLKLGSVTAATPTPYAITAGTVTTATLAADKATYVAGSPLILTVTLKDAQGNPAPGQAGTLTAETVKAANAELKGTWAEAGTAGTYSATYTAKTAGTGLKASLKLGSTTAASGTYAITAGTVTAATLTADKATYVAGGAITLTVELKDAQGNLVPNQAGTLTAETVKAANAELKGTWAEAGTAGTYSATYTANKAGSNLKASLKLGSVTAATPTPYAITAGTVTTATLAADKATYVAGSPLILTVTLKDAQGNPAPGQAGTLTAETVKAANAELKGTWAEAGTAGTYSATYTAKTAGTGLKASLKLGSTTAASGTYAITAGTVTAATLTADKATYVAGGAITLTVELKDAQGNLVPNQAGTLTAETVKAANAELKGTWTETTPGTYSATYTAKTAGTGLKANLTLGSVTAATPTPYAITAGAAVTATSEIKVGVTASCPAVTWW
ncbi:hypothetical protein CEQ31_000855 [Serratia odorifera]|uniref:invasin domain 3-containing protein n=1 Tax=Serratia odorifera TaxID=618 RepID=UPI000B4E5757|nr:invasin domain 3-containing protein [Serratia odorifera]PNK88360.1 hypothetical protein CEQ31_000855 [Serratia odorifera]